MNKSIWLLAVVIFSCSQQKPLEELSAWLANPTGSLTEQPFAQVPLSKEQALSASKSLLSYYQEELLQSKGAEWDERLLKADSLAMPFFYKIWGDTPEGGHSLFISLHGGGSVPAEFNDGQYNNQKHLYDSVMTSLEGVYLAPRAAVDAWNMWHQPHVDSFLTDLIRLAIVKEGVNPNKVYLLGYSAGGDGVYQLAPRMAPYLAAASMMAGHPDDASPLSLRNLPYALHAGALDSAFKRNEIAANWGVILDSLHESDPEGYIHQVQVHAGRAHWMYRDDAVALPWMAGFVRNENPKKVVWIQDDAIQSRFYWLQVPLEEAQKGKLIHAAYSPTNQIEISTTDYDHVLVNLNDSMVDLNKPIVITLNGQVIFESPVQRSIASIAATLESTIDQSRAYPVVIAIDCKTGKAVQKKY